MSKVYVVTKGDYSDYRIMAVFSTREKAKAYVALYLTTHDETWGTPHIETWRLDESPEDLFGVLVNIVRDGTVIETQVMEWEYLKGQDYFYSFSKDDAVAINALCTAIRGTDKERAVKVANERRTRYLAEDRWGKPFTKKEVA